MKLKNTFLFSSALISTLPMGTAVLANEASETQESTISFVLKSSLTKAERQKIRKVNENETVKANTTYKMVYKKISKSKNASKEATITTSSKEKVNKKAPKLDVAKPTASKETSIVSDKETIQKEKISNNSELSNVETTPINNNEELSTRVMPQKVANVVNQVSPSKSNKVVGYGTLIGVGLLSGASFYIIKNKKGKTVLIALLVSGGIVYATMAANADSGKVIAPTRLVVAGTELKPEDINGYEYLGVIEYNNATNVARVNNRDNQEAPKTEVTTVTEAQPTNSEKPVEEVKKGSVIVRHVWSDGTEAYPTETIVDNMPVGTSYNTSPHLEDVGLWTKDGTRYESIKDVFPNQTPDENGFYSVHGLHGKFGYEGTANFVKFHNVHEGYNTTWQCYYDEEENQLIYDKLSLSKQLDRMKNVTVTSESVAESQLPNVLKNKLKDINSYGGVNQNAQLYYVGLDPIQEFKYVGTSDNSSATSGKVKEGTQEITYVYNRDSYKVKQGYLVVCPTDHM